MCHQFAHCRLQYLCQWMGFLWTSAEVIHDIIWWGERWTRKLDGAAIHRHSSGILYQMLLENKRALEFSFLKEGICEGCSLKKTIAKCGLSLLRAHACVCDWVCMTLLNLTAAILNKCCSFVLCGFFFVLALGLNSRCYVCSIRTLTSSHTTLYCYSILSRSKIGPSFSVLRL